MQSPNHQLTGRTTHQLLDLNIMISLFVKHVLHLILPCLEIMNRTEINIFRSATNVSFSDIKAFILLSELAY